MKWLFLYPGIITFMVSTMLDCSKALNESDATAWLKAQVERERVAELIS